jgi:hypothetical protein
MMQLTFPILAHLALVAAILGFGYVVVRMFNLSPTFVTVSAVGLGLFILLPLWTVAALSPFPIWCLMWSIFGVGIAGGLYWLFTEPGSRAVLISALPVAILLSLVRPVFVAFGMLNVDDDLTVYFPSALNLLEFGRLDQPFSLRRLGSYEGQSVLSAWTALLCGFGGIPWMELYCLPLLLCFFVARRLHEHFLLKWVLIATIVLVDSFRENFNSQTSGVVLAVFLGVLAANLRGSEQGRAWIPLAICGASLGTLRAHFVLFALFFCTALVVAEIIRTKGSTQRSATYVLFAATGAMLLMWAPSAWDMYRSSGTPFYPLFRGFENTSLNLWAAPTSIWRRILESSIPLPWPLIGVCVVYLVTSRASFSVQSFGLATLITAFGLGVYSQNIHPETAYRYVAPLITGFGILGLFEAVDRQKGETLSSVFKTFNDGATLLQRWKFLGQQFATVGFVLICVSLVGNGSSAAWRTVSMIDLASRGQRIGAMMPVSHLPLFRARYQGLLLPSDTRDQGLVALASPLHATSRPTYLRLLDIPGYVAPPTSKLSFSDPRRVLCDWHRMGIRWFAFENPDSLLPVSAYTRSYWGFNPGEEPIGRFGKDLTIRENMFLYFRFLDAIISSADCAPLGDACLLRLTNESCDK